MDQLKKLLSSLSWRQRVSIALTVVAVVGSLAAFTSWRREHDFRPLYTGLSAEDAGALVEKLRQSGVEYRLAENGSAVLVPSARVAETRLQMAAAGLPRSGRVGFELFDKTNFGITEFAEHINYQRALEGELERSVMALAEVQQARVHVTFPKESVFLEARQPAKASVMLRLRPGARIAPANVVAVAHLVASAVEGLAPEAVSVLDMNGNLLNHPRRPSPFDGESGSEAMLDFRQQVEKDLVAKIHSTLEPLLGPEKFRAGVSVECDFSGGEQSEETFDPSRTVMASTQKTEDVSGLAAVSGIPGTASNLPRPVSRPGGSGGGMSRRTENITFQTSRLVRRVHLPQGTVKRISAAILVDQHLRWEGTGAAAKRVLEPPSPETLKTIRDLVSAAVGLSTDRGDQLIVETLPFEATLNLEPPPPPGPAPTKPPSSVLPPWLDQLLREKNSIVLAAAGAGAVLLLVLLAGLWFWRRRRYKQAVTIQSAVRGGAARAALESGDLARNAELELESKLVEKEAERERQELEALHSMKLPRVTTKKTEVLTKHLVEVAKKDPIGTAHVLRSWLREQ
jgi:flagellar M-ring protein FliF